MTEVEVKARANLGEVERRLREKGAKFLGEVRQVDTYYNAPHRDFAETDEALRLRSIGDESTLTYKGPKIDSASKSREEITLPIDHKPMAEILDALGFARYGTVVKSRRSYRLADLVISLDDVENLGTFIEIETYAEEGEFKQSRKRVFELLEKLGLRKDKTIRDSYLELISGGCRARKRRSA